MKNILVILLMLVGLTAGCGQSNAAVLVIASDGSSTPVATLAAANSAASAAGKTIVIASPQTLTANITLAADRAWKFEKGAVITTTGYILNVNEAPFEAGDYQVFAGSGTVTGMSKAKAIWFGSTDYGASINAAQAGMGTGGTIILPGGTLPLLTKALITKSITLTGSGRESTVLEKRANIIGIEINMSGSISPKLENFRLTSNGSDSGKVGINVIAMARGSISNIKVDGQSSHGIYVNTGTSNLASLQNIITMSNGGDGLRVDSVDANAMVLLNIDARSNAGNGMYIKQGKDNFGMGITCQLNTGYGLLIDSINNVLQVYTESNTAGSVSLTAASKGNYITSTLEQVTDAGSGNIWSNGNLNADYRFFWSMLRVRDGVEFYNSASYIGKWTQNITGDRLLKLLFSGSSAASTFEVTHSSYPTYSTLLYADQVAAKGKIFPDRSIVANQGVFWTVGTGTPESVVAGPVGSLYSRIDGGATTSLYVKTSGTGTTGWTAK